MMHIPKSETTKLEVLSFEAALAGSERKTYDPEKWIYIPDFYSEYRYLLGTRGKRPLICVGINPSTAEPDHLDNTLSSVQRIALNNGFDSFLMFNVYAQRATNPNHMERELNALLHRENMKAFEYILQNSGSSPAVWAAWGTVIEKRPYLALCVRDMIRIGNQYGVLWYSVGERSKKNGHPHHPLYLKKDSKIDPFDIESYLDGLAES